MPGEVGITEILSGSPRIPIFILTRPLLPNEGIGIPVAAFSAKRWSPAVKSIRLSEPCSQ